MTPKIKYNWFGIASRQGNTIWLNKNLLKYPALHAAILEHEKSHTSGYAWHDFIIDLRNNHLKGLKGQYYRFIIKNPSSWAEFLPLWSYEGQLVINPLVLALYGITLAILGGIGWLLG